jgi:hypothetical protein
MAARMEPDMRLIFLLCLSLLLTSASTANDRPTPIWQGVWKGTIGPYPVQLCLSDRQWLEDGVNGYGAYYYLKYLKIISLDQKDAKRWIERGDGAEKPSDPVWQIGQVTANQIMGSWQGSGRQLPIRLARVANGKDEPEGEACGSKAFMAPRIKPLTVREEQAQIYGVPYRRLIADAGAHFDFSMSSFALDGEGAATARINEELRKRLVGGDDDFGYVECMASALSMNGSDGYFEAGAEPVMILKDWLAVRAGQGDYCGGAHPNWSAWSMTFDRSSGEKIDPTDWFSSAAFAEKPEQYGTTRPINAEFRSLLVKRMSAEETEQCADIVGDTNYWGIGLTREGIEFTPSMPHVAKACENPVLMPYADIAPYLNEGGKEALASIEGNILLLPQ